MGKLADLVLWKPSFFGAKPELIVKGGAIAWANMGDPNASIPTPEPVNFPFTCIFWSMLYDRLMGMVYPASSNCFEFMIS